MDLKLEKMQHQLNQKYEKEGLTDDVLDMQLDINKLRNKHDISDKNQIIYKTFVQ